MRVTVCRSIRGPLPRGSIYPKVSAEFATANPFLLRKGVRHCSVSDSKCIAILIALALSLDILKDSIEGISLEEVFRCIGDV